MTPIDSITGFLEPLLTEGRIRLRTRPEHPPQLDHEAVSVIDRAFKKFALHVAGPSISLDLDAAVSAAQLVRQAGWFLLNHGESDAVLEERLVMPGLPQTAAQHLSADLFLRYLPQLHQRAKVFDPADRLTVLLAQLLRAWPLSGVLSAVDEEPTAPLEFAGHPGLRLLYAERLAENPKPAWVPNGAGRPYVELVWQESGRDLGLLRTEAEAAAD
jgi:hypothetical protein